MSYSSDLIGYKTYRGESSLDLQVDVSMLLYKLANLLTGSNLSSEEILNGINSIANTLSGNFSTDLQSIKAALQAVAVTSGDNELNTDVLPAINTAVGVIRNAVVTFNQDKSTSINQQTIISRLNTVSSQLSSLTTGSSLYDIQTITQGCADSLTSIEEAIETISTDVATQAIESTGQLAKQAEIVELLTGINQKLTQALATTGNSVALSQPALRTLAIDEIDTEFSITLPEDVRAYKVTIRKDVGDLNTDTVVRYAYKPGIVATRTANNCDTYGVLTLNSPLEESNIIRSESLNIYFAAPAAVTLSVRFWL